MGIKEGTLDEPWVLYESDKSLNPSAETNITLYVNWNLNKNLKKEKEKKKKLHSHCIPFHNFWILSWVYMVTIPNFVNFYKKVTS